MYVYSANQMMDTGEGCLKVFFIHYHIQLIIPIVI